MNFVITLLNSKRVVLAASLGNLLEIYSFSLFTMLLPIITPVFFPTSDPSAELILAYVVFSVGFLAYPIGALIFGYIGDRYGRRTALYFSMIGMALSTFLIGFLPSYQVLGILSPIALACLRSIQGACAGGECMGGGVLVIESLSNQYRGFFGSLVAASATFGALIAALISLLFTMSFFPSWSWRLPFISSLFLGILGIYLRTTIEESPHFKGSSDQSTFALLKDLFTNQLTPFLCAIGIGALGTVPFYLVIGYLNTYLVFQKIITTENSLLINLVLMFFCFSTMPIAGYIADKLGYARTMIFSTVLTSLYAYPLFYFIFSGNIISVISYEIIFLAISQLFVAPINAFISQIFPARTRYTGTALGYCIGMGLFGGTTPYISLALVNYSGNSTLPCIYVMFVSLIGFVAVSVGRYYSFNEEHETGLITNQA